MPGTDPPIFVAQIVVHLLSVIVVAVFSYPAYIYMRMRHFHFIKRRAPVLVLGYVVCGIFLLSVTRPLYVYGHLFPGPGYQLYLSIGFNFFLAQFAYGCFLCRMWLTFFRYKYYASLVEAHWRKDITHDTQSWWIRSKDTFGNSKVMFVGSVMWGVLMGFIVAFMTKRANATEVPPSMATNLQLLIYVLQLVICFVFYMLNRKVVDVYGINLEYGRVCLHTLMLLIFTTLVTQAISRNSPPAQLRFIRNFITIITFPLWMYDTVIWVLNHHGVNVYFNSNVSEILASHQRSDMVHFDSAEEVRDVHKEGHGCAVWCIPCAQVKNDHFFIMSKTESSFDSSSTSPRPFIYKVNHVLEHHSGIRFFMDHLVKTLCAENMLFLMELSQIKSRFFTEFGDRIESPKNVLMVPDFLQGDLVKSFSIDDPIGTCRALFMKYICIDAGLEVNIHSFSRGELYEFFTGQEDMYTADLSNIKDSKADTATVSELYHVFDDAEIEVISILRPVWVSFRFTPEYQTLREAGVVE